MKRLLNYLPFHFVVLLSLGIYSQFYDQFWKVGFLKIVILIAILLNILVVWIVLKLTATIERIIGSTGIAILKKVFGIILLAIAVKLFASNVQELF